MGGSVIRVLVTDGYSSYATNKMQMISIKEVQCQTDLMNSGHYFLPVDVHIVCVFQCDVV